MKYRVTDRAVEMLDEITYFIALDKPNAAEKFYEAVLDTFEAIADFPLRGRKVDFLNDASIRKINIIGYTDWLVFYRVGKSEVVISVVINGSRDLPSVINDL